MPAGLDGNPNPVVTPERQLTLGRIADRIMCRSGRVIVGVDGASGTGKSTFADELSRLLAERGRYGVRSTTDSFHRPRAERLRRGPASPVGYYRDSHDLAAIVTELLRPFRDGATEVRTAAFDEPSDSPEAAFADGLTVDAVLVFDGLFLHRPELVSHWDVSVYLVAEGRREERWERYLYGGLPCDVDERQAEIDRRLEKARWRRYSQGWQLYLDDADPAERATIVVDNDDLSAPRILAAR